MPSNFVVGKIARSNFDHLSDAGSTFSELAGESSSAHAGVVTKTNHDQASEKNAKIQNDAQVVDTTMQAGVVMKNATIPIHPQIDTTMQDLAVEFQQGRASIIKTAPDPLFDRALGDLIEKLEAGGSLE